MKALLIITGIVAVIFISIQLFAMSTQRGIEEYPFKVVKDYGGFEVRSYEASLFTSVTVPSGAYDEASSRGFSALGGYIFGDNETNEKIAMTSPVVMSMEDSMTMMFMVPKSYKKEDLPSPNKTSISFQEEPPKTVAAISFGGWANDEKIEKFKQKLINELDAKGIKYSNKFYFLGYNAPYEMVNRKNEVIVELAADYQGSL
jgi:hypothetical protein